MRHIAITLYLFIGAYQDMKTKKISAVYLGIGIVLGLCCLVWDSYQQNISMIQFFVQLLPGSIFLIYGKITGEKIGYGDGFLLLILGCCFSYPYLWYVWSIALFLMTLTAGWLLCVRKIKKNTKIAFLPFLLMADLVMWGTSYV